MQKPMTMSGVFRVGKVGLWRVALYPLATSDYCLAVGKDVAGKELRRVVPSEQTCDDKFVWARSNQIPTTTDDAVTLQLPGLPEIPDETAALTARVPLSSFTKNRDTTRLNEAPSRRLRWMLCESIQKAATPFCEVTFEDSYDNTYSMTTRQSTLTRFPGNTVRAKVLVWRQFGDSALVELPAAVHGIGTTAFVPLHNLAVPMPESHQHVEGRCPECDGVGYHETELVFGVMDRTVCPECLGTCLNDFWKRYACK